ncbi:VOC family protein [Rhizorhabdus argentea]|uniref:VOC family protein n=1 Tax=Rhizorhabdus argentea TaxID=1387174 RepID=UPI0030EB141E
MTAMTLGFHHVGLTVPDVETARAFFCDTLGWHVAGQVPSYPAVFVSDGTALLTLWRIVDPTHAVHFDRKMNIGLHHLALGVADDAALDMLYDKVRHHPGVEIEFAPGPVREGSQARHFICAIPGGVRVEFATPRT